LGNEYAKECIVTEGNHSALSARFNSPQKILEFKVNHVPVRSPRQILRKALMGSYALALKQGRQRGEGYHWDEIAKIARDNDYDIGLKHLMEIALYYAAPRDIDIDIDFKSPGIGKIGDNITFSHLAKPSLIRDYDLLTLSLIDTIAYSDK
jgi:hypothetical protein